MKKEDILFDIETIIGVPILMSSKLKLDLNMDSLDIWSLVSDCEKQFLIEIKGSNFTTIEDLVNEIQERIRNN